ncbi:2-C-methyl-D-erythritol 4-phosphate cytidylyltransferase [Schlesneria paludicola]|uniref:2-C-methyl-D-erythritol 4-phosphate cytidylyltransferase n=1 Tax=Schlesneria paludicola TaxID=360056 RepID=UPI00029B0983|nr:2-C-methyl-D-erythritol 4-phosphate cytidylyltransferase [Schlesneria paludicola]
MSKFAVILPAAGKSSRYSQQRKKVFVELKGRPVWVRTAEQFVHRPDVVQTILVISPDDLEWFKEKFRPNLAFMDIEVVTGGAERADSVLKGLERVRPDVDFVAVHDAARPLIVKEWIDQVFRAVEKSDAAILATPVTSTLKRTDANQKITETVSREHLWAAQTPQVFRRQLLIDAYAKRGRLQPTDEAQLVEQFGKTVQVVPGSALNLKITTPEDFRIAEHLLDALPKEKLPGFLHPFEDERL